MTKSGYMRINIDGKRVLHHRYVMQVAIGRPLKHYEVVHHIDGDKANNNIDNLELIVNNVEHQRKHHKKKWYIDWSNYAIPERMPRKITTCLIGGCGAKPRTRGLCEKHFVSFWRWSKK